jgi:glycerate-2-kinase
MAREIAGREGLAFLAGCTDGTDGPTDAAGGLVDGGSIARAAREEVDIGACLANSDSHRFLEACGGLVKTGPTQSNVNDVMITVRAGSLG